MIAREDADEQADHEGRDGADVEVGGAEAHLQRQAVRPGVAAARDEHRVGIVAPPERAHALDQHQAADGAEHDDVEQADDELELALLRAGPRRSATPSDEPRTPPTSSTAPMRKSTVLPLPVGEEGREGGARDLVRGRGDGDRGRDADEEEERRQDEAAADPEHAGEQPDHRADDEQAEAVDGDLGDGEVDLHRRGAGRLLRAPPSLADAPRACQWQGGGKARARQPVTAVSQSPAAPAGSAGAPVRASLRRAAPSPWCARG